MTAKLCMCWIWRTSAWWFLIRPASRRSPSLGVGRMPFGLALSPDGKQALRLQRGNVQLLVVPGYDAKEPARHRPHIPGVWIPLEGSRSGRRRGGQADCRFGRSQRSGVQFALCDRCEKPFRPKVLDRIRTGLPIGDQVVGGSSPGAVVAGKKKIFVSNATQDSITVIDARSGKLDRMH